MANILQFFVQSTIRSGLYALVAIGFTLIFGVGGVLNLAHGASILVGAYGVYFSVSVLGLPTAVGFLAGVAAAGVFGAILYLGLIEQFTTEPIMVMILTLVTSIAVELLVLNTAGAQPVAIPQFASGNFSLAGTNVQFNQLAIFVISWVIIGALFVFINYTRTGKAILAVSMSEKGASLVGIDSHRINLITWVIAGALAGVAGIALGSQLAASPVLGRTPLVLSFSIVVLGGIGSIRGSVVGAYLIGFLEVFVIQFVSSDLSGIAPLVVLVLALLVKPEGLFGRELAE
ncbi:branched-chain amino acid ABC transporter permease [Halobacteriales archaeon SW_6_65_46]|nr:MAG: branched-chain amino acid ABC transporter permease [Halobacteriales archaeon SW_6_65_46]